MYDHVKGVDVESKTMLGSPSRSRTGKADRSLRDDGTIGERWLAWLIKLLNAQAPTLHTELSLAKARRHAPTADVPSRYQAEKAMQRMAKRKAKRKTMGLRLHG